MNKVVSIIAKLAPTIGTVLGGPLAGTAIAAIEGAMGIKVTGTESEKQDQINAAISGATPDQLLALKNADNEFAAKMAELGFKDTETLAQLQVQDRESARNREVSVKDSTPRILAYILSIGALGVGIMALFHRLALDSSLAGMVIGYIFSEAKSATAYYFGASPSVDLKNEPQK
jgi:hypothetical protein